MVFITMNGISSAEPPTNDTDNRTPNIDTESCKISLRQNTCHIFMLNPSIELPTNMDSSDFNQIAVNLKPPKKTERFTFTTIEHHGWVSYTHGALESNGIVSASFGLSRAAHNENLEIVDGDTSNEHARVNLIIQLEAIPAIEKYVQFFASTGYFTIAK